MDIKELEKMLKMCRKQGVTELTTDGLSFKLGELPRHSNEAVDVGDPGHPELTPEQMLFYSVDPEAGEQ